MVFSWSTHVFCTSLASWSTCLSIASIHLSTIKQLLNQVRKYSSCIIAENSCWSTDFEVFVQTVLISAAITPPVIVQKQLTLLLQSTVLCPTGSTELANLSVAECQKLAWLMFVRCLHFHYTSAAVLRFSAMV